MERLTQNFFSFLFFSIIVISRLFVIIQSWSGTPMYFLSHWSFSLSWTLFLSASFTHQTAGIPWLILIRSTHTGNVSLCLRWGWRWACSFVIFFTCLSSNSAGDGVEYLYHAENIRDVKCLMHMNALKWTSTKALNTWCFQILFFPWCKTSSSFQLCTKKVLLWFAYVLVCVCVCCISI